MTVTAAPPEPGPTRRRRRRGRPRTWTIIAAICADDLRHLRRDRTALILMVVMPVLVMLVVGATFGAVPDKLPIGVVVEDGAPAAVEVRRALESTPALVVTIYEDAEQLRQDVRTQILTAGVIVPAGFGAAVDAGSGATVTMVADLTQTNSQSVAAVVRSAVTRVGRELAAARFAVDHAGVSADEAAAQVRSLVDQVPSVPVQTETLTVDPERPRPSINWENPYSYTAISNLVLFVFVSTLAGGTAIVERRQLGITRRMLAAPVTTRAIVLGTAAARLLVAVAQSAVILLIGRVLFGVHWGDPLGVALVIVTFAALATGLSLLVGSLVRTPNQIQSIGVPVSIALAMLGGCMWPLEIVPRPMQVIGHFTPHAWAMDAWMRLAFQDGRVDTITRQLAVLTAAAVVLAVLSTFALRRSLVRS